MKQCPDCGMKFNWWQRAIGEYKQHVRHCSVHHMRRGDLSAVQNCRGCPAECFEKTDYAKDLKE